ncbi:cutinase [Mycolicibacterium aurum]|uniref:Cutinase n=1 Tax=Mycolicibacterium aurum TaxID=1791 RepID=A0A448ISK0_MYCAU|nr:cutinase family protein [Mycolicibacterium aurum]VEG55452.1 cutinase [Mycolicibacterium aurum]
MLVKRILGSLGAAALTMAATMQMSLGLPSAAAQPCPDIEVIFARGTGAPPGLGWLGEGFVESLRGKVGGRSVGAYGVNYPASFDFDESAPMGAADATARVQWMADNCPDTKLVLGGNSQGAGVIDLITVDPRPLGRFTPTPMPPHLADHVSAVAVFGNPLRDIAGGGPLPQMSGAYGGKSIDLCSLDDPFCSSGFNFPAHFAYIKNGMVEEAANFVAGRVQ